MATETDLHAAFARLEEQAPGACAVPAAVRSGAPPPAQHRLRPGLLVGVAAAAAVVLVVGVVVVLARSPGRTISGGQIKSPPRPGNHCSTCGRPENPRLTLQATANGQHLESASGRTVVVQEGRPVRLRVEYSAPAQVTVSSVEILLSTGDIRIEGDRIIGSHQTVYAVNAPAGPIACQWRAKSLFGTDRLQVALFWTGTYQGAAFGSLVTLGYVRIAS